MYADAIINDSIINGVATICGTEIYTTTTSKIFDDAIVDINTSIIATRNAILCPSASYRKSLAIECYATRNYCNCRCAITGSNVFRKANSRIRGASRIGNIGLANIDLTCAISYRNSQKNNCDNYFGFHLKHP